MVSPPTDPESFILVADQARPEGRLLLQGSDVRGLLYGLLELTERVTSADAFAQIFSGAAIVERPANEVRSVARLFCSEVEDKPWFYDLGWWDRYLSMLVAQRFNRFSLTLGLGYNYHRAITDAYFYFAYPFLVSVPGCDVRVTQLPAEERERNLATLRAVSDLSAARGLDFQLGLWTHAFEWIDSPEAHHTIDGLDRSKHAGYCRDAVQILLGECPAITGLTFRIHGESGVPEGSWDFWRSVFEGVADSGREVGIDLHAKGLDERTLGDALETGLPVTVSPKFWAEHMGLPYHQASIRESERPARDDPSTRSEWHRYMRVSEGSRPFTRYGYADFLREDRGYDIVFRLWAGTQRLLSWGDPVMAAAYGRAAYIAGTQGLEWCEPLTFKGREGSGRAGPRTGYSDPALRTDDDWEKFGYAYRLFGRLTYDPDASPDAWRPFLRERYGEDAIDVETGLASASRILPLVTTAHHPSASNNYYWPEMYTDMPIVWTDEGTRPHPYIDMPEPRRFGTVSPLDPEVFSSVADLVDEVLSGEPSGRVSPLEVANHLERLADESGQRGDVLGSRIEKNVRRQAIDIAVTSSLGRFFAGKIRAATWFEVHSRTRDPQTLRRAIEAYRAARDAWVHASAVADAYERDIPFGREPRLRGHWHDRLSAIDDDLHDMEARSDLPAIGDAVDSFVRSLEVSGEASVSSITHEPPISFVPGRALRLEVVADRDVERITLRFRPMNQALAVRALAMERSGDGFEATVPAGELDGTFPLAYAFVVRTVDGRATRFPGLGDDLCSQPYFVVRRDVVGRKASGTQGAP